MLSEREVVLYGIIRGFGFIDQKQYLAKEIEFSRSTAICPPPDDVVEKLEPQQDEYLSENMKKAISSGMCAVKIVVTTNKKDESTKLKKGFDDIHKFISTLRIIKPNLAYPQYELVYYPQEKKYFLRTSSHLSNCFSIEMNIDKKGISLRKFDVSLAADVDDIWKNIPHITMPKTRIWRAFVLHEDAYFEDTDEVRILLLAIALECLFSTERTNMMHNLASRTARFLTDNIKMRKRIYRHIILAYNIRSMIVHGLKDSIAHYKYRFAEVVFRDILRKCLRKIIQDENLIKVSTSQDHKVYHTFLKNLGLRTEQNLIFEDDAYWIPITKECKIGPYCRRCWRKERLPIKMQFKGESKKWRCPQCDCYVVTR